MSKEVDERVVKMEFDNSKFEKNVKTSMSTLDKLKNALDFKGASKGLEEFNKAANGFDTSKIERSLNSLENRFSTMGIVSMRVIENITDSMMNLASKVNSFMLNGIVNGGISRSMNLENAHFQLQGLLKDESKVGAVMKNVSDAVDGTAYSLDAAAKVASQLAASGMQAGDDMFKSLRAVAGVASMTNSSYEEIGRIFTQVAGQGRVMGDQLLQLSTRGMNAAATLADYMTKIGDGAKVTEAEIRDMVSKGKISFETFSAAMDDAFGEHAKKANENFTGAMSNVKSALARIGAEFVSPLIAQNGPLVQFFNALRERINDLKKVTDKYAASFVTLATNVIGYATKILKNLNPASNSKWDEFTDKISKAGIATDDFQSKLIETAKEHGIAIDDMIKAEGSLANVFSKGKISGNIIIETIKKFVGISSEASNAVAEVTDKVENLQEIVNKVIRGDFGNGAERIKALTDAGYDYASVQNLVNEKLGSSVRHISELTEEQLKNAGQVSDLSDAQLKNIGYTEEQISAIRELADEAEKAGTPLNELILSLEKPSAKDLFIDSLKNTLQGLIKIISTFKKAWQETFKSISVSTDIVYNIANGLHTFSEHLIISDEAADKLKRTIKGLFSIFDVFITFTGGTLKAGLKLLSKLLGLLNVDILSVTASVGDAVVKFKEWLHSNNIFVKGMKKVISVVESCVVTVRNWINSFLSLPIVQNNIVRFQNAFKTTLTNIKKYLKGGSEQIAEFIDRVKELDSFSFDNIKKALTDFKDNVIGYFMNMDGIFDSLKTALIKLKDDVSVYLEATGKSFDWLKNKLVEFSQFLKTLVTEHIGEILTVGLGVALIVFIQKINKALQTLASPILSVQGLIDSLSGTLSAFATKIKAEAVLKIAEALFVLVASIAILTKLDQSRLLPALGVLGLLAAGLTAMSIAIGKFGGTGKTSISMAGIAASVLILAAAMKKIESLDRSKLLSSIGILVILAAGMGAFAIVLSKFAPKLSSGSIFLLSFAGSLKIIVSALSELNTLDLDKTYKAIPLIIGIIVGLGLVTMACKNVKVGSAAGILASVVALKILVGMIDDIANLDMNKIKNNLEAFALVFGAFIALMFSSKFAGANAAKGGVGILAMAAALLLITAAMKSIAKMDSNSIDKSLEAISKLMLVFAAVVAASNFAGKNAVKAGTMLLLMSASILILSGVIVLLSKVEPEGLNRALGAITILGGVFAALIAVTSIAKDCKGTLTILAVTIGVLAVALGTLSMIDPSRLKTATAAISTVIGMFSVLVASTSLAKKANGTLIILTAAVGVLGGVLYLLAGLPAESALSASAALSMLLLSLSASMVIISAAKTVSGTAYATLGIMVIVVGLLGGILALLASLNVGPTLEIAKSLSILLLSLSGACLILSAVGLAGPAAFVGVGALITLIGSVGALMAAIGALVTYIPQTKEWLDSGLPVIEKIGYAIGSFIGNIVSGFAIGATQNLSQIGNNLSEFMESLSPFLEGAKSIDASCMDGIKTLAEAILMISGADIISGIASWITGESSLAQFAAELSAFGEPFATFAGYMVGIDFSGVAPAAEALSAFCKAANEVPNQGISVVRIFVGDNTLTKFAEGLSAFGEPFATFAGYMVGIDFSGVAPAAEALSNFCNAAKDIPNQGGLVAKFTGENNLVDFAVGVDAFGEKWKDYADTVAGVDFSGVEPSAKALAAFCKAAKDIPNQGLSIASIFVGDNDLGRFAEGLGSFALALSDFSTKTKGISVAKLSNISTTIDYISEFANIANNTSGSILEAFGKSLVKFGDSFVTFCTTINGTTLDASSISAVSEGVSEIIDKAITAANSKLTKFTEIGKNIVKNLKSGVVSDKTALAKPLADILVDAISNIKDRYSGFASAGNYLVSGLAAGIRNGKSQAINEAIALAREILNAAKKELDIHSPSVAFQKEVGEQLGAGMAIGIKNSSKEAEEAMSESEKAVLEAAKSEFSAFKEWLEDKKFYGNLTTEEELYAYEKAAKRYAEFSELKQECDKQTYTLQNELLEENYQKHKDYVDREQAYNRMSAEEYIAYWQNVLDTEELTADDREAIERDLFQKRQEYIEGDVKLIEEELNRAKVLQSTLEEGSEEYSNNLIYITQLTDKYNEAVKESAKALADAEYETAMNALQDAQDFDMMTGLAEKLAYFKELLPKVVADEEKWKEVTKQIYSLTKQISEKTKEYEENVSSVQAEAAQKRKELTEQYYQDQEDIEEKYNDKRIELEEEYADKVKEINDQLESDIKALNDEYTNALKSRANTLYTAYGLFDEVSKKDEVSGDTLMKNLQDQIDEFNDWENTLASLSSRGIDEGFIEELQEMGVSSIAEVKALNNMTDSQLQQYVTLWATKHQDATDKATAELENMRIETQSQIAALRAEAKTELDEYEETWQASMNSLNEDMLEELKELRSNYKSNLKSLNSDTKKQLQTLQNEFEKEMGLIQTTTEEQLNEMVETAGKIMAQGNFVYMGENMVNGLIKGIGNRTDALTTAMNNVVTSAITAVKTAAEIASPSKKFAKLGEFMSLGLVKGVSEYKDRVSENFEEMTLDSLDVVADFMNRLPSLMENESYEPVITPVIDLDEVISGRRTLDGLFGGNTSRMLGSVILGGKIQNEYSQAEELLNRFEKSNDISNKSLISSINSMKEDISELVEKVGRLQVVMDSGALVGAIAPEMDGALGRIGKLNRRGAI